MRGMRQLPQESIPSYGLSMAVKAAIMRTMTRPGEPVPPNESPEGLPSGLPSKMDFE